ncbi:MAG TPA: nuclease [Desulfobacteraceae bacterium]|nr:nuclease [Desulfobacteraceae bacterium]
MSRIILLDAGPLGMITHPKQNSEIKLWMQNLIRLGTLVRIPEIADYEVRRELLRAGKTKGIERLDALKAAIGYIPITTEMMLKAAEFWAQARMSGRPIADHKALDADVILAAQAFITRQDGDDVIVATTNVGHLSLFVSAKVWNEIPYLDKNSAEITV